MFWALGKASGAFWAMAIGHPIGLAIFVLGLFDLWPLHFLENVGLMTAVSSVIYVYVSLRRDPPEPSQLETTMWSPGIAADDQTISGPWYTNIFLWTCVPVYRSPLTG